LTDDIVLTGNFIPFGSESAPFTGNLYGNGKKITGLSLTTPVISGNNQYLGLFAVNDGVIRDLSIINATLNYATSTTGSSFTKNTYIGLLSGLNSGSVYNVFVSGSLTYQSVLNITGNNSTNNETAYIGGIFGESRDSVVDSHVNVVISAQSNMFTSSNGIKENIDMHVGGAIGLVSNGFLLNTYAQGNTTATSTVSRTNRGNSPSNNVNIHVGGLVGTNQATVSNSFARGNITSSITVQNAATNTTNNIRYGGLVGQGSSTKSYRSSLQTLNITSGPILTLNNTGTSTNDTNLRLASWIFNQTYIHWSNQIWELDGTNYPRLKNNTY